MALATKKKTKKRSRVGSSSLNKKKSFKNWMVIPIVLVVAVAGYVVVNFSHASSNQTSTWGRANSLPKYTAEFKSPNGYTCFSTTFKTRYGGAVNASYKADLQIYFNGEGWTTLGSSKFQANGNYDHHCWSFGNKNYTWRFKFYETGIKRGAYGDYQAWGYKHK